MVNCLDCDITVKLDYCCGSNPETGKKQKLILEDGETVYACPNLDPTGFCQIYDSRPTDCREYQCPSMQQTHLVDLFEF